MGIQDRTGLTRLAEAAAWRAPDLDPDPANPGAPNLGAWNEVSLLSTWRGERAYPRPWDLWEQTSEVMCRNQATTISPK